MRQNIEGHALTVRESKQKFYKILRLYYPLTRLSSGALPKGEPLDVAVHLVYRRNVTAGVCSRVAEDVDPYGCIKNFHITVDVKFVVNVCFSGRPHRSEAYNIKASISEGGGPCLHGGRSFANKCLINLFVVITPSVAIRRQLPQGGAFK